MPARPLNIIGAKLRELREKRGLALADLAGKCQLLGWDVSGGTLAKIESLQRSAFDAELYILRKALRVDFDELIQERIPKEILLKCLAKPSRRKQ